MVDIPGPQVASSVGVWKNQEFHPRSYAFLSLFAIPCLTPLVWRSLMQQATLTSCKNDVEGVKTPKLLILRYEMEDHERAVKPKPKMTKAERRELQEKQRAAKSARNTADGHGAGAPKPHSAKPAQAHVASTPAGLGHTSGQVLVNLVCRWYIFYAGRSTRFGRLDDVQLPFYRAILVEQAPRL